MKIHTFRLRPGQDLYAGIAGFAARNNIQAGCILSGVGSLTHATLRLANRDTYTEYEGYFEIVSITGTVAVAGAHLHIAISDSDGTTTGGHLFEGCRIYTTAEIVLAEIPGVKYRRELCADSGYEELAVHKLPEQR